MGSTSSKLNTLCVKCNTIHDKYGYRGWGWSYCKECNKCVLNADVDPKDGISGSAKMYKHCFRCNKHHDWCITIPSKKWFGFPIHDPLRYCYTCKECLSSTHFHCNECDNRLKHTHCNECNITNDHCHKCKFVEGKNFHCIKCTKCHLVYKNQFFCNICKKCVNEDYKHTLNH